MDKTMIRKELLKKQIEVNLEKCNKKTMRLYGRIRYMKDIITDDEHFCMQQKKHITLCGSQIHCIKIEVLLFNSIEKNAPEILITKLFEKRNTINYDLMEQLEDGVRDGWVEENCYLEICNEIKSNYEILIKLVQVAKYIHKDL
jgi:hypothetical protein